MRLHSGSLSFICESGAHLKAHAPHFFLLCVVQSDKRKTLDFQSPANQII